MKSDVMGASAMDSATIEACAHEPIHVPGSIQPHGVLLVVNPETETITHASANAGDVLKLSAVDSLGKPLSQVTDGSTFGVLQRLMAGGVEEGMHSPNGVVYDVVAHTAEVGTVIEFERALTTDGGAEAWPAITRIVDGLKQAGTTLDLCTRAAQEVKAITGFARVKVYKFDADWNGEVLAEARDDRMASYLNLHFPASDIPAQARHLYAVNRIRLIPDAVYKPVPMIGLQDIEVVDMTHCVLRSVSPVHLEYLQNMGVGASMSVSIMHEDRLWGLIACHHDAPLYVPQALRSICSLVADLMGLLITSRQEQEDAQSRKHVDQAWARLAEAVVRSDDYVATLLEHGSDLLDVAGADGVAILTRDAVHRVGELPTDGEIRQISECIDSLTDEDVFSTRRLAADLPGLGDQVDAAGVLSIALSRVGHQRILWFRREVSEEVVWAGNPEKSVRVTENGTRRLHPRASFERWKTIRRGESRPWGQYELQAADALRRSIIDVAIVRAERLARLNARLAEANDLLSRRNRELQEFTLVASHDLQEPLRKIRSFSHLLRDEYDGLIDDDASFYLERMHVAADRMSVLILNLLEYARLSEEPGERGLVDMNKVASHVARSVVLQLEEANGSLETNPLPTVFGNERHLHRMLECLVDNAIKFADPERPLTVEITAREIIGEGLAAISVTDNGIGFESRFADRVLQPFEQVHPPEQYGGTGIGLAIVKRVVDQHGGTVSIESEPGKGTTVEVRLPLDAPAETADHAA